MTPRTPSSAPRATDDKSTGNATDETTKAERSSSTTSPSTRARRPRARAAAPTKETETLQAKDTTPPPPPAPGMKPWEAENNETRTLISVRLPESVKARQDGLIDWLNTHDESDIPDWLQPVHSATDLSCYALHLLLARAEDELNEGKALPQVMRRRR